MKSDRNNKIFCTSNAPLIILNLLDSPLDRVPLPNPMRIA